MASAADMPFVEAILALGRVGDTDGEDMMQKGRMRDRKETSKGLLEIDRRQKRRAGNAICLMTGYRSLTSKRVCDRQTVR